MVVNSIRIRALRPSEYIETAKRLFYNLREADAREADLLGMKCLAYVFASILHSKEVYGVWKGHVLLAVTGVSEEFNYPDCDKATCVWCLGTEDLDHHRRDFVRYAPSILSYFTAKYGRLGNFINKENKAALLWIRRMGATFKDPVRIVNGIFLPFVIERSERLDVWSDRSLDGCHDSDAGKTAEPTV